jgi:S-formylglutathione hydrolase
MSVTTTATIASFGGKLLKLSHAATTTKCEMKFNLFLPPQAQTQNAKIPVLIYLSGLTCTPDNCSEKGFFQHAASKKGIAVLYPDTSPRMSRPSFLLSFLLAACMQCTGMYSKRNITKPHFHLPGGLNIQGEDESYDFGSGAGFYVDATKAPYNAGYNMYSYVTEELPKTVFAAFPQLDASRVSITGHSMGGHGALTLVCYSAIMFGCLHILHMDQMMPHIL